MTPNGPKRMNPATSGTAVSAGNSTLKELPFPGALEAKSEAFEDNHASTGVSRALGYQPNGTSWATRQGVPAKLQSFVLTRDRWELQRRDDITIEGLGQSLGILGLDQPSSPQQHKRPYR